MKSNYTFEILNLRAPLKSKLFSKKDSINLIKLKSKRFSLFKIAPAVHAYLEKELRKIYFTFYSKSYKMLITVYLYKRR